MPPLLANYYVTYKCNSRCTYCDIPIKPENVVIKETSPEVVIENLAALKRLGVKVVDFTGGEPLIYKHLPQVLKAAKDMGFFTSIANTGTAGLRRSPVNDTEAAVARVAKSHASWTPGLPR